MRIAYLFTFCSLLAAMPSLAAENPIFAATMKAISADVDQVALATAKAPDQVKPGTIQLAIARCRTAKFSFSLIQAGKDGEFLAPVIAAAAAADKDALNTQLVQFLTDATNALTTVEGQLQTFAGAQTQANQDAVKATLAQLEQTEQDAHKIFNPAP